MATATAVYKQDAVVTLCIVAPRDFCKRIQQLL